MPQITLKAARVNAGFTQEKAAELLHVAPKTIVWWEAGRRFPTVDKVYEICKLYNVKFDDISFLPKDLL